MALLPTVDALKPTMNDLGRRIKAFLDEGNRANRQPTVKWVDVSGPLDRRFVAGIQLMINEIGTTGLISVGGLPMKGRSTFRLTLDYGITAEGEVVSLFAPIPVWRGAERAYKRCVQEWADVTYAAAQEAASKRRVQARTKAIKEDLMAKMWHPDRVAALLEKGGWDLVDGC